METPAYRMQNCPDGCGRKCFKDATRCRPCSNARRRRSSAKPPPPTDDRRFDIETEPAKIVITSVDADIDTVKKAIEKADVDLDRWRVAKQTIKSYQVGMNLGSLQDGKRISTPAKVQLFSIAITLVPRVPHKFLDALDLLRKRLGAIKPSPARPAKQARKGDILAECFLTDHHFGKLSWAAETGENYDLKIAERLWRQAVDESVAGAKQVGAAQVLLPIGSDLAHFDNVAQTTTAGTPLDSDGRWPKVYSAVIEAVIYAVEQHRQVAPVHVMLVGGNHDEMASWWVVKAIELLYRGCKDVTVDTAARARKAYIWGTTFLGFAHRGKLDRLPYLFMREYRRDIADCRWVEIHTGDKHIRRKLEFVGSDEFEGVIVRVLPALCPADKWHYEHGFIHTSGAETYYWSKTRGFAGMMPIGVTR